MQLQPGVQSLDNAALWESYAVSRNVKAKESLSRRYVNVVRMVVRMMNIRAIPPLEEQDLMQIGYLGLNDAIDRFDPTRGMKFETYAQLRIRGMIVDELRSLDWVPRAVRESLARYRRVEDRLQQEICAEVTREEVLDRLAQSGTPIDSRLIGGPVADVVSLHPRVSQDARSAVAEEHIAGDDEHVLTTLIRDEMRGEILRIIRTLPPSQRDVLELHYFRNVAFQEIAKVLGVSGPRVSQLHRKAIVAMRAKLKNIMN